MPIQNALNITETGVISHDGNGKFEGSPITNNSVLLGSTNNKIQNTGLIPKGNLLVGNGITTPTILPLGSDTQVLTADSTQPSGVKWATPASGITTLHGAPAPVDVNTVTYFTDFLEEIASGALGWTGWTKNLSGIDPAKINNQSVGLSLGSLILSSSGGQNSSAYIGNGTITMTLRINYTALGLNAGDKFSFGFSDSASYTGLNNRVGIGVDIDQNATNWLTFTTAAGVSTVNNTGVTIDNPAWRVLKFVINNNATQVDFFIDNVLVATHTTNIPLTTQKFYVRTIADSLPAHPFMYDYVLYNQVCSNDRS